MDVITTLCSATHWPPPPKSIVQPSYSQTLPSSQTSLISQLPSPHTAGGSEVEVVLEVLVEVLVVVTTVVLVVVVTLVLVVVVIEGLVVVVTRTVVVVLVAVVEVVGTGVATQIGSATPALHTSFAPVPAAMAL
jgi:hypothetical protein